MSEHEQLVAYKEYRHTIYRCAEAMQRTCATRCLCLLLVLEAAHLSIAQIFSSNGVPLVSKAPNTAAITIQHWNTSSNAFATLEFGAVTEVTQDGTPVPGRSIFKLANLQPEVTKGTRSCPAGRCLVGGY